MKISEQTISALGSIITGDGKLSPYRTGPQLIIFFNEFGSDDIYADGFPSRWRFAEEKLREFNDSPVMKSIMVTAFDPRHFLGTQFNIVAAVEQINQFLEFDGYELKPMGKKWDFGPGPHTPAQAKLQGKEILECITCGTSRAPTVQLYVFPQLIKPAPN